MQDQVQHLNSRGIKATSLSLVETESERKQIERDLFSVVYSSPRGILSYEFLPFFSNFMKYVEFY